MAEPKTIAAGIASTGAGLFTGSALYISVVQHPSLMQSSTPSGFRLAFFRAMLGRAAPMQASLATLSGIAAVTTGLVQREPHTMRYRTKDATSTFWITSGTTMVAIVPYTLLTMKKLNRTLLEAAQSLEQSDVWIDANLTRWGRLHRIRTGLSLLAFTGMISAMSTSARDLL